jgi:hypothetical protein
MNAQRGSVVASRVGCATAILLFSNGIQGQAGDDFIIVDGARPVAAAVIQLIKRHPVVVTYEDPRYTYAGDLKDVTEEIRNPQAPRTDGPRIRVPVGGHLQIRYSVSTDTNKPVNLGETLENIVRAKVALPAGGRFRVEQSGSVFHVVASQVRDPSGQWVEHMSVLDVPITLDTRELGGFDMVRVILDEITAKSGVKFEVSAMPVTNLLANYQGSIKANNELAREVMLRTLQGMSKRLTWLLYYDSLRDQYVFNIVPALEEPTIEIRGRPALPPRQGDPTPTGRPFGESSPD